MKALIIMGIVFVMAFSGTHSKSIHTVKIKNQANVISPQELLKSKRWNVRGKSVDIYYEYSETEETLYVGDINIGSSRYYISSSNCFEQPFDFSKVGQINSGRFLVTEDVCYYITVIDESTIQISYLSRENPTTTTLIAKE
jgi:hypothetical protein